MYRCSGGACGDSLLIDVILSVGRKQGLGFSSSSVVKNSPVMPEMWVQSLGQEDPLEKGLATYSSILAGKIPQTEEPAGYSSWGCKESNTLSD